MTKKELINTISSTTSLSKVDASLALDAMTDTITNTLKKGDSVQLMGFGSFVLRDRAARTGRNPQTGATIAIPATKVVGFKAGKALKDAINTIYKK